MLGTWTVWPNALNCERREDNDSPPPPPRRLILQLPGWVAHSLTPLTISIYQGNMLLHCSVWRLLFGAIWSPFLSSIKPFQTVSMAPVLSMTLSGSRASGSHCEGETAGSSPGSVIQLFGPGKSLNLSLALSSIQNNPTWKIKNEVRSVKILLV